AAQRPRAVFELIRGRVALRRHALAALTPAVELVAVQAVIALVERGAAVKVPRAAVRVEGGVVAVAARPRVSTVIVAPELRPFSAWKFEVWTRTSAIESSAGAA